MCCCPEDKLERYVKKLGGGIEVSIGVLDRWEEVRKHMKPRRFPRYPLFPREGYQDTYSSILGYSMNQVWRIVGKIADGKKVKKKAQALVDRWFGISMTKQFAKQCIRKEFDGKFRMPRLK